MSAEISDKFSLLKRATQEIVEENELKTLLKKKERPLAYWGTAPTGRVHIGYFVPLVKVADFLNSDFDFKILIADYHSHLDNAKTPWHLLDARSAYYEHAIRAILTSLGVDLSHVAFIRGSSFQLEKEYVEFVLRMSAEVTLARVRRAASEVVKFGANPHLGGFIYPLMQIADVKFLGVDATLSGIDQRGIYMLGREIFSLFNLPSFVSVFTPMLPGLRREKMSASDESSKIDILDAPEVVEKKALKAFCVAGDVEANATLTFIKQVIFPLKGEFKVERAVKWGGDITYKTYEELEKDFVNRELHPLDLKKSFAPVLNDLLAPIREYFKDKEYIVKEAYKEGND